MRAYFFLTPPLILSAPPCRHASTRGELAADGGRRARHHHVSQRWIAHSTRAPSTTTTKLPTPRSLPPTQHVCHHSPFVSTAQPPAVFVLFFGCCLTPWDSCWPAGLYFSQAGCSGTSGAPPFENSTHAWMSANLRAVYRNPGDTGRQGSWLGVCVWGNSVACRRGITVQPN